MKFKHIDLTEFQVKFSSTGAATIEGYGSIFGNIDSDGDIVMPGSFTASLKSRMPMMLYQHKSDKIPGIWEKAAEDSKGLYLTGKTIDTTLGRDTAEELRSGALTGMSIGYSVKSGGAIYDKNTRILKDLDLYETSLVTFPANEQATVTNVKAALESIDTAADLLEQANAICCGLMDGSMTSSPELMASMNQMMSTALSLLEEPDQTDDNDKSKELRNPRTLERILREAGYSKRDARGIVSKGTDAFAENRCEAEAETKQLLQNLTLKLKG